MLGQEKLSIKQILMTSVAIGALTGLGLSFTALPILATGAIIAAVSTILLGLYGAYDMYKKGRLYKYDILSLIVACLAASAIGVGVAGAATAIFPGAMLGMGSAAVGALIGAIAPIPGATIAEGFPKEMLGKCYAIGALTGLGLSFTALPILATGAIIAAVPTILLSLNGAYYMYKYGRLNKCDILSLIVACLIAPAIGVGIAGAVTAIFPGAMLGIGSAVVVGALIGAIAPFTGFVVTELVESCLPSSWLNQTNSPEEAREAALGSVNKILK